ncbi:Na+/H+ antiporter NhaA [Bdellovibrionota bacterium FG-1]
MIRRFFYRSSQLIREFSQVEAASGVFLLAATLLALAWANSPYAESYSEFWHFSLAGTSLLHWVNEGWMTIFFLLVGLEIKRELFLGELRTLKKAVLPVIAAFGGMLVPALIYYAINRNTLGHAGWGIPMATDIAFAVGMLALVGNHVPPALKVFLLALAIVDDMGAITVIALFFSHPAAWIFLLAGVAILAFLLLLNRKGINALAVYLLGGIVVWLCFLKSGIQPTIAGVLVAMVIPLPLGASIERRLHPWVAFGIMPLFALANAGVPLGRGHLLDRVSLGIILGLVLGKQIGITLFSWLAVRLKVAELPRYASWPQLYGVAALGGIGFTMSLFIANLALGDTGLLEGAKIAVLFASVLSAIWGAVVLGRSNQI